MLSICIITKNEKTKLNRCLNALKPYPLEVVVIDTGSTDGTGELLDNYANEKSICLKTGSFAWCDDFAAARNYAVSQASNDIILMLDSDEVIEKLDAEETERIIRENPDKIGRIRLRNRMEQNGQEAYNEEYIGRVFHREHYRYQGRIHEQLTAYREMQEMDKPERRGDAGQTSYILCPVSIRHDGYTGTPEQRREKAERNIRLLKRELEENGDDPYLLYQLGKSCYLKEDYNAAAESFSKGLCFDLDPSLEYVIDMVETYGYALLNAGRAGEALQFENIYEEFGQTADFRLLMGLIYMNNEMFDAAVREFMRAAECRTAKVQGANTYLAYYNAGVIAECLGQTRQAAAYYKQCGAYEPAKRRLAALHT